MKRFQFAISAGLAAAALICADSIMAETAEGAAGDFVLQAMTHTPDWPNATDVEPWDGESAGTYVYRAIPCSGNAPMNNISSNLPTYSGRIEGARSPASTRTHPMRFTVEDGRMQGTIAFTVCKLGPGPTQDDVEDSERDQIMIEFQAEAEKVTPEEMNFRGQFTIAGGTGEYSDLTGEGVISGYMFCFDPQGCAANENRFRDMQLVLEGTYSDPTFPMRSE